MKRGKERIKQGEIFIAAQSLSNPNLAVKALIKEVEAVEAKLAEQQDITEAKATYEGFISLFKWGTIVTIIVTAIVVLIIA